MVKSWFDFWCRLGALASSMKYQALLFSTMGLIMGAITGPEWVIVLGICVGGRILTDLKYNATHSAEGTCSSEINTNSG